jgi:hypothetical protein
VIRAHGRNQFFKLQPPLGAQFAPIDEPLLEIEAKLETFSSSLFPLHEGHVTSEISECFNISDSNSMPQSRHENSKSGINSSKSSTCIHSSAQRQSPHIS